MLTRLRPKFVSSLSPTWSRHRCYCLIRVFPPHLLAPRGCTLLSVQSKASYSISCRVLGACGICYVTQPESLPACWIFQDVKELVGSPPLASRLPNHEPKVYRANGNATLQLKIILERDVTC